MATVACPACGEDDRLRGQRKGDTIELSCLACGELWTRGTRPKCLYCGSEDLRPTPIPIWSRGRGTMQTPSGTRAGWTCEDCGATDATRPKS